MNKPRWVSRLTNATASTLGLLGILAAWADSTPVAGVVESRPIALACAVAALALLAWRWRADRRQALYVVAAALTAVALVWSGYLQAGGAYRTEEVVFHNGDVRLVGTIVLPPRPGPHPGVVFVHGAHCETRVEYYELAKRLARHGIAALSYDKRGCGESAGKPYVPYETFAADAVAAHRALGAHAQVDPRRVGFFGHSEGGWVAPIAATTVAPAFLVLQSATPLSPAEQVIYQAGVQLRRDGYGEDVVSEVVALQRGLLAYLRGGEPGSLGAELEAAARQPWFAAADLPERLWERREYAWWISVMDFDLERELRRVRCPVLAIHGGLDDRSDARTSLAGIARIVREDAGTSVTTALFPHADHPVVEWPLGRRVPPPRRPAGYYETLVCWIQSQAGLTGDSYCTGWRPPAPLG